MAVPVALQLWTVRDEARRDFRVALERVAAMGYAGVEHVHSPFPFTEIGTGCIDFPAIAATAKHAEWFIVEQDFTEGDPFESARLSLEHLKRIGLA